MKVIKYTVEGYMEEKVGNDDQIIGIKYNLQVKPITLEGEAVLDLSDLPSEERKKICNLLEGVYNEKTKTCVVRIKIDATEPIKVKILKK